MLKRLLASSLLALSCSAALAAHEYSAGDLHIEHPWARELPPNAPVGAAYFVIHNKSVEADRLISAQSPIADKAELHTHVHVGEVMKMQRIESVALPAGGEARFAPGGNHVMLFGLKQPLVAGEEFPLTLQFEKAGTLEVQVKVENQAPAPATPGEHAGH